MSKYSEIESIIKSVEKEYGEGLIFLGDMPDLERIPFSSPILNYMTRGGGAYRRFIELVGKESSGKTTLALDQLRAVQEIEEKRYQTKKKELEEALKKPKLTAKQKLAIEAELEDLAPRLSVILDLEHTIDPKWMRKNGVDTDLVYVFQVPPTNSEPHLETLLNIVATGKIACIIIDSLGAVISEAEESSDLAKGNYGGPAKALTKFYKKAVPLVSVHHVAGIVINQEREDLSGYNQLNRPGGTANKFAQSLVLRLRQGDKLGKGYKTGSGSTDELIAKQTNVQVNKNKLTASDRQNGKFTIKMGVGIDKLYDTVQLAQQFEWILKSGAWYKITNPKTGEILANLQGEGAVVQYLKEDPELAQLMWDMLYAESIKDEFDLDELFSETSVEEEE